MSHVIHSETGIVVSRLLGLEETPDGIHVRIRWKGLDTKDDTLQPIARVNENVPVLFSKLLSRKSTPSVLAEKVRSKLAL